MFCNFFASTRHDNSADLFDRRGGKRVVRSALRSALAAMCVTIGKLSDPLTSWADKIIRQVDFHMDATSHMVEEQDDGEWFDVHLDVANGNVTLLKR